MTSNCLSTTAQTTDGSKKAPFDPDARQVGSDGLTYADFFDALVEKPDPSDPCNAEIRRYRAQGRSEAFCREFRAGYDNAKAAVLVVAKDKTACEYWAAGKIVSYSEYLAKRAQHAGFVRASEAFPDRQDEASAQNRRCVAGFARATKLRGEYHEA